MRIKVSDYIFDYISHNVQSKTFFMLPGGGCMHLVDSLGRNKELNYICMLHEQAAAIAAEAYAQNINDVGLVLVTAGPGSTNAITGVAGAYIDSTPMLVLSGQAKCADRVNGRGVRQMGIQEVDIENIVKPITKYSKCITCPQDVPYELQYAIWIAKNGRKGPVWLDIPLDVQGAEIELDECKKFVKPEEAKIDYNKAAVEILELLKKAKRPAIYVGNGVRASNGVQDFIKLVENLQIPVLTSWKAADFLPDNHPLFVGRPGIIASRGANFVQQTADCLLILGTRLDLCQTGFDSKNFAPKAKKIMVDIDEHEIDKLECDVQKYVMDATMFVKAMLKLNPPKLSCMEFLRRAKEWQVKYPVIKDEYCDESNKDVNLYHLIKVLGELLDKNDLLVPGSSGACAEFTMQAIKVPNGLRIQNTPGLGSMGFGLPACIGACVASHQKRTICVIGDGGLQHNIQELETLHRLNLPIKLFVLNNGGYGSIFNMQKGRFDSHFVACHNQSGLTLPNLEKISKAYGLLYKRIENPKNLKNKVEEILNTTGTIVCEVFTSKGIVAEPKQSSKLEENGNMVPMPMENLYPFLDNEILEKELKD